ncbi:glycosyltransferase family 4 protein [uncultured Shewanella sp.]|uniref:glycosyltransferase family 4 protein n=1 Tax=uncultured Shewanella sp. TaxID=173975 RepID=UPI00261C539E|nr:glycosyltransferase family 4 protein [uncultured Shewanella sp.]
MKSIYIIYRAMFNHHGEVNIIGGIENYILSLIETFEVKGWQTHIVQPAKKPFTVIKETHTIHGINTGWYRGNSKKYALAKWVETQANGDDIVIFATDSYAVNIKSLKTIAVQHGVSWDKPRASQTPLMQLVSSLANHIKYLTYTNKSNALVCVDHNFINWYRTWFDVKNTKVKVIYNFFHQQVSENAFDDKWQIEQNSRSIKLIIARRFVDYRGIAMIIPVIEQLVNTYPNLVVTFAGEGPLEAELKATFKNHQQVQVTQYKPEQSFEVHQTHHFAVIPTLGSEGTSLSMIEAMAAGCLVISSNVGGLSNLILNGHNGHLILPDATEFKKVLEQAILDIEGSRKLAFQGHQSIKHVCSFEHWQQQWVGLIEDLTD